MLLTNWGTMLPVIVKSHDVSTFIQWGYSCNIFVAFPIFRHDFNQNLPGNMSIVMYSLENPCV